MPHYATLRDFKFDQEVDDVRGAVLYGEKDEKLGTIDDVILDHSTGTVRYAVVDSNGWLPGGKYLVPAARIVPYHKNKDDFYADLDKERIRMFPKYNEKDLEAQEKWRNYEDRYEAVYTEAPVTHREGSTHAITPEAGEVRGGGAQAGAQEISGGPERKLRPETVAPEMPPGQPVTLPSPAGLRHGERDVTYTPGKQVSRPVEVGEHHGGSIPPTERPGEDRWARFRESVRRHRERIVGACPECGKKAA